MQQIAKGIWKVVQRYNLFSGGDVCRRCGDLACSIASMEAAVKRMPLC